MWLIEYLSDVFQEATGRYQGPWATSPVPGSVSFLVIRAIVFSISHILNFRVSASANDDSLYYLSFLRVALNSWVSNYVACFNFNALVWPVAVEYLRDTSSGGYTPLPIKEVSLHRSEISSPAGSRASGAPPSSDMSSSSTAYCIYPDVMEGSSAVAILKPDRCAVLVRVYSFLLIWHYLLKMVTISSYLPCACA